jgi:predicted small metal-binding protein
MKIHSVFNSSKQLLATFTDKKELHRFLKRHCREASNTTILTTKANSWNEVDEVINSTNDHMEELWGEPI